MVDVRKRRAKFRVSVEGTKKKKGQIQQIILR